MTKTLNVNGVSVKLRASAAMTLKYKAMYNRDIIKDISSLQDDTGAMIGIMTDVAYMMACLADKDLKLSEEEWADQFEFEDLYQVVIPEAMALWKINIKTTSTEKNG